MEKSKLRQNMIKKLRDLDPQTKSLVEKKLAEQLITSKQWMQADIIALTISKPLEWSTKAIIEAGWKMGKTIVVPKCEPEKKQLHFYEFTSYDDLETVYYGLKEPKADENKFVPKENIDLIIVPGLVFDQQGYRIGFGGGYYDRFLEGFSGVTLSLIAEFQLIPSVPKESFDIPVQDIITNERLVE